MLITIKNFSIKRAYSVGNYLIENGIKSERLQYKGMGSTMPVAKNKFRGW